MCNVSHVMCHMSQVTCHTLNCFGIYPGFYLNIFKFMNLLLILITGIPRISYKITLTVSVYNRFNLTGGHCMWRHQFKYVVQACRSLTTMIMNHYWACVCRIWEFVLYRLEGGNIHFQMSTHEIRYISTAISPIPSKHANQAASMQSI